MPKGVPLPQFSDEEPWRLKMAKKFQVQRRRIRQKAGLPENWWPIYVVLGDEQPTIIHESELHGAEHVRVGMGWLIEHEPELAASIAFES